MTFDKAQSLIKKGDVASLRRELENGSSPDLSNQFSWSLLMLAAMTGDTCIGDLLISKAADITKVNDWGETALSLAAHAGHIPFMKLLLGKGAPLDSRPHGHALEDWLTVSSGLGADKIAAVLELIEYERAVRATS